MARGAFPKTMMGYRFLRQRPIGKYIVDFFSKELKLIIELDGYTHQFEEVAQNDKIREKALRDLGYEILRFEDEEVFRDMNNVVRTIENWIMNWKDGLENPEDTPPSRGWGGEEHSY